MDIYTLENLEPLFMFVDRLENIKQSILHHPEGNVLVHTMQVVNLSFRETHDTDLIPAAMLHDIGKFENSYGHEKIAVEWLRPSCSAKTLWLIENHMRIWYYLFGNMRRKQKCEDLVSHPWLMELIQLARWDYAGRRPGSSPRYDKLDIVERLNNAAMKRFERA